MDEKGKAILAGFTGMKKRSQLTPHRDLIYKLHQRGCTFREIIRILSENYNLTVAPSTVFRFIDKMEQEESRPRKTKSRKVKPFPVMTTASGKPMSAPVASNDEIRQKIVALKQRTVQTKSETKPFDYDPDQPLRLVSDDEKL